MPISARRGSRITAAVGERRGFGPLLRLTERREAPFVSLRVFLLIVTLGLSHPFVTRRCNPGNNLVKSTAWRKAFLLKQTGRRSRGRAELSCASTPSRDGSKRDDEKSDFLSCPPPDPDASQVISEREERTTGQPGVWSAAENRARHLETGMNNHWRGYELSAAA